ncbi:MAG: nicotinate-nucleotide adenylyltransferase [Firmicutes bacterium]|nr:nicotinate-nucleotide adenylyltransferase [Bacillota bacterium]
MARRVAIMGGTFDPIHYGHLLTAETVREKLQMDQVLIIPTGVSYFKINRNVTPPDVRFRMVEAAVRDNPWFFASPIETERDGYTYTVDTIHQLRQIYSDSTEFYFIIGADAISGLSSWYHVKELVSLCHFVSVNRPGYDSIVPDIFNEEGCKGFYRVSVPEMEISSSDLRERVRRGESIRYMVPEIVEQMIYQYGLYQE